MCLCQFMLFGSIWIDSHNFPIFHRSVFSIRHHTHFFQNLQCNNSKTWKTLKCRWHGDTWWTKKSVETTQPCSKSLAGHPLSQAISWEVNHLQKHEMLVKHPSIRDDTGKSTQKDAGLWLWSPSSPAARNVGVDGLKTLMFNQMGHTGVPLCFLQRNCKVTMRKWRFHGWIWSSWLIVTVSSQINKSSNSTQPTSGWSPVSPTLGPWETPTWLLFGSSRFGWAEAGEVRNHLSNSTLHHDESSRSSTSLNGSLYIL